MTQYRAGRSATDLAGIKHNRYARLSSNRPQRLAQGLRWLINPIFCSVSRFAGAGDAATENQRNHSAVKEGAAAASVAAEHFV
jgi:hypothetical protein